MGWRVILLVLTSVCWCNQVVSAVPTRDPKAITADVNALLPQLVNAAQGLWIAPRGNPSRKRPRETLQQHYNDGHGPSGSDTRVLPFFNGVPVIPIDGPNPATAEEVVMANFIATIVPGLPVGFPVGTQVRKKSGGTKEIQIPVPAALGIQVTKKGSRGIAEPARFCSIILPEALPVPAGTLAPPPTNICTLFFTG